MTTVLLIGLGPTALSALNSLAKRFTVLGVVRRQDSIPMSTDPVVERAQALGIPVFSDATLAGVATLVSHWRPACVVVSSYDRILPTALLAQCPFINVHYSPLPQYRGRANVNWAIINGETGTAMTVHTMVPELDAGNILFQQDVPIQERDTVADLYRKLDALQEKHLAEAVEGFLHGYAGRPQDLQRATYGATYGCSRTWEDGEIDWTASTTEIDRLIRALAPPFPGAYTYFQGRRLMVWKAEPVCKPRCYQGRIPGRVVGREKSAGYIEVLTGDGMLRIFDVQFPGEAWSAAAHVIKSVRATLGLRTVDLLGRIEFLEQHIAQLTTQIEEYRKSTP